MKTISTFVVAVGLCAASAWAQPGPGRHDGGGRPPVLPVMTALDANKDGTLDATEIAGASAAITKAFPSTDGKISVALLMPQRPSGTNEAQMPARGGKGKRPAPPLIHVLDANQDGYLDNTEVANASTALLTLDRDKDGTLSVGELHPPRPGMQGGPRGGHGDMPMPEDGGPGAPDMQEPPPGE